MQRSGVVTVCVPRSKPKSNKSNKSIKVDKSTGVDGGEFFDSTI